MSLIFSVFDIVFKCLHLETMFVGVLWDFGGLSLWKGIQKNIEYVNCGSVIYF